MLFLCEFELVPDEDWFVVKPFGLSGATQGHGLKDAAEMAYDWLRMMGEDLLMQGQELPNLPLGNKPQEGGKILLVGADVSLETISKVTASEAARLLGVSRSRISQMLNNNKLEGFRVGRDTYVTTASIDVRLAERPKAGRPRKDAKSSAEERKSTVDHAEANLSHEHPKRHDRELTTA